jgi:hypothetical protein
MTFTQEYSLSTEKKKNYQVDRKTNMGTTEHIILYKMQKPGERGEGRGMKKWINNGRNGK